MQGSGISPSDERYMDAVENSSDVDVNQETRRPPSSAYHVSFYQHGVSNPLNQFFDYGLDGGPITDLLPNDYELDVETTAWGANAVHTSLDDLIQVKSKIESDLNSHTTR